MKNTVDVNLKQPIPVHGMTRSYTLEIHGETYKDLANMFATNPSNSNNVDSVVDEDGADVTPPATPEVVTPETPTEVTPTDTTTTVDTPVDTPVAGVKTKKTK